MARQSSILKKQLSNVSGASADAKCDTEADLEWDEIAEGTTNVGRSAHRCSLIKGYNIKTFFTPAQPSRR